MTDRERVYGGLSNAAWGYFFLHIHFKLNTVDILPVFVGYLLLLSAIGKLSGERRDLALLRPLGMLLAGVNGVDWPLSWAGADLDGTFLPLDLLVIAAGLYFHFQFLTDMAALAEQYQPQGGSLDRRLRRRRTVYIVLYTVTFVCRYLPFGRFQDQQILIMMALVAAMLVVMLFIMAGLFELRRCFRNQEENQAKA